MIVKVNGQEFDSNITPIVISFFDNNDLKNIGKILSETPEPHKNIIAYPTGYDRDKIEALKELYK
jgi:hypothetical protein